MISMACWTELERASLVRWSIGSTWRMGSGKRKGMVGIGQGSNREEEVSPPANSFRSPPSFPCLLPDLSTTPLQSPCILLQPPAGVLHPPTHLRGGVEWSGAI